MSSNSDVDVDIIRVNKSNWNKYSNFCKNAEELYIHIFSDPPYNEVFNSIHVKAEFEEYIKNGCFLIAIKNQTLVGFLGATKGMNHLCSDTFISEMRTAGIDCINDIYISELGVSKEHRGMKIGNRLINKFMNIYKNYGIFLRTGAKDNDFVIKMYNNYGFNITNIREQVENKRNDGCIDIDERLYMYRKMPVLHTHFSGSDYMYDTYDNDGYRSGSEALYG